MGLSIPQQIEHCKNKGITFNKCSEERAKEYLEINSFYRLRSYRKNFNKNNLGQYINLDFDDLIHLSIIDFRLRRILLGMTLNLEHYLKLQTISSVMNENPGHSIYLLNNYFGKYPNVKRALEKKKRTPYIKDILDKYEKCNFSMPIWAYVEMISFSEHLHLAQNITDDKKLKLLTNQLYAIKDLRNACAHDNCLLNDLSTKSETNPSYILTAMIGKLNIPKNSRKNKLSNARILQISSTLAFHKKYITNPKIHKYVSLELQKINKDYLSKNMFDKNYTISSSFGFLSKLLDNWYKID